VTSSLLPNESENDSVVAARGPKVRPELVDPNSLIAIGQQPLSENPAISVRLSEPPSVEGTCGGQMDVNAWLAVDAVEIADCVEKLEDSPGNSSGT